MANIYYVLYTMVGDNPKYYKAKEVKRTSGKGRNVKIHVKFKDGTGRAFLESAVDNENEKSNGLINVLSGEKWAAMELVEMKGATVSPTNGAFPPFDSMGGRKTKRKRGHRGRSPKKRRKTKRKRRKRKSRKRKKSSRRRR